MKINLVVKRAVSWGSGAKNSTPVHSGTWGTRRHIVTCPLSKSPPWITEASRNIAASLNCVRDRKKSSMTHFTCQQIVWGTLWYSICWWCLFALCFCCLPWSVVCLIFAERHRHTLLCKDVYSLLYVSKLLCWCWIYPYIVCWQHIREKCKRHKGERRKILFTQTIMWVNAHLLV